MLVSDYLYIYYSFTTWYRCDDISSYYTSFDIQWSRRKITMVSFYHCQLKSLVKLPVSKKRPQIMESEGETDGILMVFRRRDGSERSENESCVNL